MTYFENLGKSSQDLILQHLNLVIEANKAMNLTRIDTVESGMLLHVEDSLSALEEMDSAPDGKYGDIGSGGGYPGIPLAIATGRETVLIDARQKKMLAVQRMIEQLGLSSQVSTYAGRAELLARKHPREFSVLTARALAKLPVLLELASPLLIHGGRLICFKAQMESWESDEADRLKQATGMEKVSDRSFMLDGDISRRILVYEKVAAPTIKLPRQEGMAQKKPLIC